MEPGNQLGQLSRPPRPGERAEAPLFERLLDREPDSSGSLRGGPARSGRPAAVASVGRELSRLFNTRLLPGPLAGHGEQGTVTAFGVPDWSAVNPASAAELAALAETLSAQARAFEPRLEAIQVELEADPVYRRRARGRLHALLRMERALEPISFFLSLDNAEIAVSGPDDQSGAADDERISCPQENKTSVTTSTN